MAKRRAFGEGTIYKRPDGRWSAQLRLPDGTRKTYYGRSQHEVRDKLANAKAAVAEGVHVGGRSQPLAKFLARWLESIQPSVRPSTFESYELNVRRMTPLLGRLQVQQLSPEHVLAAYGRMLASGLSARSVQQAHAVLHRALHNAVGWRLIIRNPCDFVSPPRPRRNEMKTLSADDLQRLFDTTREDRLHALWVLLGTAGLRIGEALGLKWEDVDFDAGRIVIKRSLQGMPGGGKVFVEPKTARSRRTVHLANIATEALVAHRKRQNLWRLASEDWNDQGLVFPSLKGAPMEAGIANKQLTRALERAGLPRRRLHDLRHTAASVLFAAGAHPKVVQELLGHSTITLTLDTYSHVIPAMHGDAARRLNELFSAGYKSANAPA